MLKSFEPCKTKPLDYQAVFREHICKTLNMPQEWPKVEPTFIKMNTIRSGFDWKTLTKSEAFMQPAMRSIQDNMEEYIRVCILLSKRFVFGSKAKNAVKNYKADWMMPWTEDKIQSNHIIFEICCFLFNYTILNFNQAVFCLSPGQNVSEYKNALQKMQYALWGAQELMRYNNLLANSMKVPLEFKPSTIEFLSSLITGLAYICIFNIMSETMKDKVNDDNLASLEKEISNNFYVVKGVIKNDSTLKKTFGYILDDVLSKYYEFGMNCLIRMANNFEKQQAEAKTKGHIGRQLAYLNEAVTLIKCMEKDSFADKKELMKKYEPIKKQYEDVKAMNDQVYKAPVPTRDQLNDIKPIEMKVRALEPKNIRVPPAETEFFNSFTCEEFDNAKSSLTLFVSNKKQHIDKTMFDLKEELTTVNKNFNVPFLKNCANIQGLISEETQKKIQPIREQGEKALADLVDKIIKQRTLIETRLREVDEIFASEEQKDRQMASMCSGSTVVPFSASNTDVMKNLTQVKESYRDYHAIEEKILADFQNYKQFLPKLCNPNLSAQQLAASPGIEAFVEANKDQLAQLKKLSDGVEGIISNILKASHEQMIGVLDDINVPQLSQKVLMNEKDLQSIYVEINERLGPMSIDFEEKVSKVKAPIGKIKDIASKLKGDNPKLNTGDLNDLLVSIDFFHVKVY
jgi:hypothetical protein